VRRLDLQEAWYIEVGATREDRVIHWLCAYDPDQHGSAPFGWHRDFADARQRLRDWVVTSGTRLDRDRQTRQTAWPGEPSADSVEDVVVSDRDKDFVDFVTGDVDRRSQAESDFYKREGTERATTEHV
jgi:hypothetical protein